MVAKKNYSRYFIILQEDEKGFALEKDKAPSGYVKLEKKNNKCKVSYYAQNLNLEKQPYHLVLICEHKNEKGIAELNKVTIDENGKLDIAKEYESNNVCDMHIDMEKILGAAIVKMVDDSIISIMSGFISQDSSGNWKSYPIIKNQEVSEKLRTDEKQRLEGKEEKEDKEDNPEKSKKELFDEYENRIDEKRKNKLEDYEEDDEDDESEYEHETRHKHSKKKNKEEDWECEEDKCEEKQYKYEDEYKEHYNKENEYPIGMVGDFFKSLVECFEKEKNLTEELKYCSWYKIPVGSIEDLYDMSDYDRYTVIYYPMLVYYAYIQKHKYFDLGFKCNESGKIQYLIYAIPGDKNKEEQPFGGKTGFVTWVSCEEKEHKGYWLMFYDIRNSSVVVPVKKK